MKLAIIGATGLAGGKFIEIINSRIACNSISEIELFCSDNSAGKPIYINGKIRKTQPLSEIGKYKFDYAVNFTQAEISKQVIPSLLDSGATIIDNSSAYRMDKKVPLIIPEINGELCFCNKLISNPNCTTIALALVLNAISSYGLKRVVVSTYQAVSGGGKKALSDLIEAKDYDKLLYFPHPITNNCLPHIDDFTKDGYTKEERKVIDECRKILTLPNLKITVTAVRIPITNCHSESINIETRQPFTIDDIKQKLSENKSIIVYDDPKNNCYPTPMVASGSPFVYVGRVRKDTSAKNAFNLWLTFDNLMKGASYNAFQILSLLWEKQI